MRFTIRFPLACKWHTDCHHAPFTFPFDNSCEIVQLYKALRDTYWAQTRRNFVAHHRLSQARALHHSLGAPLQF